MLTLLAQMKNVVAQEEGQGLAEYMLVTLLIVIPVAGSVAYCGSVLAQFYSTIVAFFPVN